MHDGFEAQPAKGLRMVALACSPASALFEQSDGARGSWFVLQTKSRQEKILARDLDAQGIHYFLPLINTLRFYGGRKAMVELPLFPGYLFLRGSVDEVYRADRTHRVAQIITVPNQQQIHWELKNIHVALSGRATFDPYPYLQRGVRVEVRSGPFQGMQGIVEDRRRVDRIILQVEMLGRAVSVELDGAIVDVID